MTTDSPPMLPLGSRIAPHLRLRAVLGCGGMATVYEAHHERLQACVAVKICTITDERADEAERDLIHEARLCARLDDPHFPRVYDIARLDDGRPYFVMEKVAGPTLQRYLEERSALPLHAALRIAQELLAAARVAHARGIAHRDIKPGNILLQTAEGRVRSIRVMDFGVAHLFAPRPEDRDLAAEPACLSRLYGTPGYMAPEQSWGRPVDGRADIYAIGVVLYEMLTGRQAFEWSAEEQEDPRAFLSRVAESRLPDLREKLPGCPRSLSEWLECATALRACDRFQRTTQAAQALSAAWADAERPGPRVGFAAQSNPPGGGLRGQRSALGRLRVGGKAAALAAAAGLVWWAATIVQAPGAQAVTEALQASGGVASTATHGPPVSSDFAQLRPTKSMASAPALPQCAPPGSDAQPGRSEQPPVAPPELADATARGAVASVPDEPAPVRRTARTASALATAGPDERREHGTESAQRSQSGSEVDTSRSAQRLLDESSRMLRDQVAQWRRALGLEPQSDVGREVTSARAPHVGIPPNPY